MYLALIASLHILGAWAPGMTMVPPRGALTRRRPRGGGCGPRWPSCWCSRGEAACGGSHRVARAGLRRGSQFTDVLALGMALPRSPRPAEPMARPATASACTARVCWPHWRRGWLLAGPSPPGSATRRSSASANRRGAHRPVDRRGGRARGDIAAFALLRSAASAASRARRLPQSSPTWPLGRRAGRGHHDGPSRWRVSTR